MSVNGGDDDGVVEQEGLLGRYVRYGELLGRGRFKAVYRGFDEKQGTDVAWAKIDGNENDLTKEEMEQVLREVEDGQKLKHDNIIKYHLVRSPFLFLPCPSFPN
jgi:serine/threonine protein kinase